MEEKEMILSIKRELEEISPTCWNTIEQKIHERIRIELFQQLSKVPSPKGSFLRDRKTNVLKYISKIGA